MEQKGVGTLKYLNLKFVEGCLKSARVNRRIIEISRVVRDLSPPSFRLSRKELSRYIVIYSQPIRISIIQFNVKSRS